ncbi:hypothetical protein PM082_021887 [Marasmius tenuissimus]|nr:hypothetical protein PM082_021887 [Marasmius tenuissimus]
MRSPLGHPSSNPQHVLRAIDQVAQKFGSTQCNSHVKSRVSSSFIHEQDIAWALPSVPRIGLCSDTRWV